MKGHLDPFMKEYANQWSSKYSSPFDTHLFRKIKRSHHESLQEMKKLVNKEMEEHIESRIRHMVSHQQSIYDKMEAERQSTLPYLQGAVQTEGVLYGRPSDREPSQTPPDIQHEDVLMIDDDEELSYLDRIGVDNDIL